MVNMISVMPRLAIEALLEHPEGSSFKFNNSWALISIYSKPSRQVVREPRHFDRLKEIQCLDILGLDFADLTLESEKCCEKEDTGNIFSEEQASSIVKFLDKIKLIEEIKLLVVHCAAGISRSGAVGLFACRYYQLDEKLFMKCNPHIAPNPYVLDVLKRVSGMKEEYEELWKNL